MVRQHADDEHDRKLLADVEQHGWHLVGITDQPAGPAYVFSVGIFHTLGQPEIAIFGLKSTKAMARIINLVGDEMRTGKRFDDWHENDDILEGYSCMFRRVDQSQYREYFGYALWFYEGPDFPMLQCVWPDKANRFPWEPEFDARMIPCQPLLATKRVWPFNDAKNRGVCTTNRVLNEAHPILLVTHDENGDWQFLCGTTNSEPRVVSLEQIVEKHPSVGELANLPTGWTAVRDSADKPWVRLQSK